MRFINLRWYGMEKLQLSVSDFVALTNQTLEYAYPTVAIEGEVASFKVNQGKFVFFDIKDAQASVGCFMMLFSLRVPIDDGMKVVVTATPKLTQWGKFSLTVKSIRPSGEGAIKKSFELLREKLDKEGLFAPDRKRLLPDQPGHIAVISSTQAAGYADFIKILGDRWGGMQIDVAQVQVQGEAAPDQIIRALQYFNSQETLPEVIVVIRGGGSADDLAAFNDERLVRAIAASRVPTLVGVGHETDTTLADLAADLRAATPSNAAQVVVPDKQELVRMVRLRASAIGSRLLYKISAQQQHTASQLQRMFEQFDARHNQTVMTVRQLQRLLAQMDPRAALRRGYAVLRGRQAVGEVLEIETNTAIMKATVTEYTEYDQK